jgi:hypothetical protein
VYADLSTDKLIGYDPGKELNWPSALLYATLGERPDTGWDDGWFIE